jgi:UDP-N-acetylmuramoyl-tripeptide--D-alanyl-D-alanine ligase
MSQSMMTLSQAAICLDAAKVHGSGEIAFQRVVTDSRQVQPGDLFVALRGERFDAHDFLFEVVKAGAAAVMITALPDGFTAPALVVPDTRLALGQLAAGWRQRFMVPVVAVTGSNGKTTVKEMISAIFAEAAGEAGRLATQGNLNNDIGLPLTLFRMRSQHQLAVLELGMNHPGETAYLAQIAQPTIALINNAQREHQEFMVNVEAVAQEHRDVILALPADGVAVFPADPEGGAAYSDMWRAAAGERRVLDFGLTQGATVHGAVTMERGQQRVQVSAPGAAFEFRLSVLGLHNVRNALAATACALAAGVQSDAIVRALESFAPVSGRLQVRHTSLGTTVIDDTYNANPDSMRAAIDVLAAFPGPRILVMGDMGEVGDEGPAFHQEIGAYAAARGIEQLVATGALAKHAVTAFGARGVHCDDVEAVSAWLATPDRDATLLVKGSRFMRMERVVTALCGAAGAAHNG